jgi:hypothetical protein
VHRCDVSRGLHIQRVIQQIAYAIAPAMAAAAPANPGGFPR